MMVMVIALLSVGAHAAPNSPSFRQVTTFECDNSTPPERVQVINPLHPNPNQAGNYTSCPDGYVLPGNSEELVPVNVPGNLAWSTAAIGALTEAAEQWSSAGATNGALNWDFTVGAVDSITIESLSCNDRSDVFFADDNEHMEDLCNTPGQVSAACVLPTINSADPCDVTSVDIAINPDANRDDSTYPSYLTGMSTFSLKQVLLHELGHVIGMSHDKARPTFHSLVSLQDAKYPNGGDFGGDQGDNNTVDMLRIGTFEYWSLYEEKGTSDTGYSNPMLKKFRTRTSNQAREVWTTSNHTLFGADWTFQPGERFGWDSLYTHEAPKGIFPVRASVNSIAALSTAKVEWYLWDGTGTCGEPDGVLIATEDVNGGAPMNPGVDYRMGLFNDPTDIPMEVPCPFDDEISVGAFYKVCAKLIVTDGPNDNTDDDTVYSEQLFEVLTPTLGATGCYCEPPLTSAACPNGTSCNAIALQLDECAAP